MTDYVEPPLPVCACEYPGDPVTITVDELTGTQVARVVCGRCFDLVRPDTPPPFDPDPELTEEPDMPRWARVLAGFGLLCAYVAWGGMILLALLVIGALFAHAFGGR